LTSLRVDDPNHQDSNSRQSDISTNKLSCIARLDVNTNLRHDWIQHNRLGMLWCNCQEIWG